jgi:hypothetical protein
LLSPLDLSHLRNKVANFIAIEFRNGSNAVDVANQIFHLAKKRLKLGFATAPTKYVTVRSDNHFD